MAPNRINARWLRSVFTLLALATLASMGGCGGGSGAPNNPFAPPPTAPASAACGANAICSGQTATAKVTVTGLGGVGIPNRQVRFDVVSGAFAIQSNDPANPLVSTLTVVSDQFGVAQVIIQANANAPTQPALLRATELTTGNQQTAQFTIVQTINGAAVLSVVPSDATITGPDKV